MKIFEKLKPKGSDSSGMYLLKTGFLLALMFGGCVLLSVVLVNGGYALGWIEQPKTAYYDIDDPMCHSREGGLIVWIDVDNWIEVQGSDQEKLAERIARTFVRREKP